MKLPPRMRKVRNTFFYRRKVDGKDVNISLGNSHPIALAKWAELEGQSFGGNKVADAIRRYRAEELDRLAPKTVEDRARHLDNLEKAFGKMKLTDVRPIHITQYLDARQRAAESNGKTAVRAANMEVSLFSQIYTLAMTRWGMCESNPCMGVPRLKRRGPKAGRYITDEELDRLVACAPRHLADAILGAYYMGFRKSDIISLRWSEVSDFEVDKTASKTKKQHRVLNEGELKKLLAKRKRLGYLPYVFCNSDGNRWTISAINSAWRRCKQKAGIDCRFHDLKHKAETDVTEERGLAEAQKLGRHSDIKTTQNYVHNQSKPVRPVR